MIASVAGEVLVRRPDHVVIDAGGVGYSLAVSSETLKSVPARGKRAVLHQRDVPCFDYTPQAVKKAVSGSGSADRARSSGWWQACSGC